MVMWAVALVMRGRRRCPTGFGIKFLLDFLAAIGASSRGKARSTSYRHSPADWPACTLPTEVEWLRSCGFSTLGESPRSPAGNVARAASPETPETSAAPVPRHTDRTARDKSAPHLVAVRVIA